MKYTSIDIKHDTSEFYYIVETQYYNDITQKYEYETHVFPIEDKHDLINDFYENLCNDPDSVHDETGTIEPPTEQEIELYNKEKRDGIV